jgi:3',5'-nucleoside bisphosphate phosphatase
MLRRFSADLHIHTCLSPCSENTMSPKRIVEQAKRLGLDMIGICDHNSTENVAFAQKAGQREGLAVIGGMEVTSREEVHILALFNDDQGLSQMANYVDENLPGINDERAFGEQLVVNEDDEIIGFNQRLLIGATTLSLREIVDRTHFLDGLAIASHIDRERFGIIGQLGFIPEDLELDGLEISPRIPLHKARLEFGKDNSLTMVTFSDAHMLEDIGKSYTCFLIEQASVEEIRKALSGKENRRVVT